MVIHLSLHVYQKIQKLLNIKITIDMIEIIDFYIRDISEENIDDYMDFFPFLR